MRYAQALARTRGDIAGWRPAQSQESVGGSCGSRGQTSVFTIGHSNHSAEKFVGLLKGYGIEGVADVRSRPYSRHAPHFNARDIEAILSDNGIWRLFLGLELGGRPTAEEFYDADGRVDYARIERSRPFLDGIHRLEREVRNHSIALLCSEEDPTGCHRRLLVGRVLVERGIAVRHIRGDGSLQAEGEENGGQPVLFPDTEVSVRKSIRSVLRRGRRPGSSER
ncbi:MAG: DUF488 domain-containing protein [Actinobacteria bacterium]|nr:DUF488 domain-containing protein [Actinomycetota bacterium]